MQRVSAISVNSIFQWYFHIASKFTAKKCEQVLKIWWDLLIFWGAASWVWFSQRRHVKFWGIVFWDGWDEDWRVLEADAMVIDVGSCYLANKRI